MIFTDLKKSSKFYVLFSDLFCVLFLSLSPIPLASAANNELPAPIEIRDCLPQEDAGIIDFACVPHSTSFAVLIRSVNGIDLNAADAIQFIIDDGFHLPYARDLRFDTFRLVKIIDDPDDQATYLWAVYDRVLEPYIPTHYPPGSYIYIKVAIRDVAGNILQPAAFEFKIESDAQGAASDQNQPKTRDFYVVDPDSDSSLDAGVEVVEGDLAGAKIIYNSSEPLTPHFGSQNGIEKPNIDGFEAIGMPLNLTPHTVFDTPVQLFIPVPDGMDIFSVGLAYHDGTQWLPAADAAGNVLPGGEGWMMPGSRVNHADTDPAQIEVQVYHFSATQTLIYAASDDTGEEEVPNEKGGSGATVFISCFIDSVGSDSVFGLAEFLVLLGCVGLVYYFTLRYRNC